MNNATGTLLAAQKFRTRLYDQTICIYVWKAMNNNIILTDKEVELVGKVVGQFLSSFLKVQCLNLGTADGGASVVEVIAYSLELGVQFVEVVIGIVCLFTGTFSSGLEGWQSYHYT